MTKQMKIIQCEDCKKQTTNFYPIQINRGRIYKCSDCYENSIRRSIRIYNLGNNKNEKDK
jgi:NAD-dependent SIR2 family protein deacetylase